VANDKLLSIYLRDHFAAAAAGRARCRAARRSNEGTPTGAFLDGLLGEIDEDAETLGRVLTRVGVAPSKPKLAAGLAAERLGRLKLNGQLTGYSPLSRLVELEALLLGVEGKRRLWLSLAEIGDPRLAEFDFGALADRATAQRDGLEEQRRQAAAVALR
jgi:hypothetical protein